MYWAFWDILAAGVTYGDMYVLPSVPRETTTLIIPPEVAGKSSPRGRVGSTKLPFRGGAPPQDKLPSGFLDQMRLEQSFALIATFEIGQDIFSNRSLMRHVFAISVDDSLYIASPLLGDPGSGFGGPPEIRRVRGNIRRPGLNLLGYFRRMMQ
jgi:hypothetical protein